MKRVPKLIAATTGICVLLFGMGVWMLEAALRPDESQRPKIVQAASPFDGARAYDDLKAILAIGPRVAGTPGAERTREFIRKGLSAAGLEIREHAFEATTPLGPRKMVNLFGIVEGTRPGVIVLGNHYDTKYLPNITFVGANDGGSTTAWMIEMARAFGPTREGRSLWLCFFDGEEAFEEWGPRDGLYGSRAFVAWLEENGELSDIEAMINVDMIGDCYLSIYRDREAPRWLTESVWNTAASLGYGQHFPSFSHNVEDDHLPFRRAGVPAINIIDFRYGGSLLDHDRNWHTVNDTLERVCPESLQTVGDVLYHTLGEVDRRLDTSGQG